MRAKLGPATSQNSSLAKQPVIVKQPISKHESDTSTQVLPQIVEEDEDGVRDARFGGGSPQNSAPGYGEGPLGKKQSLVAMIKEQSAQASKGSTANSVGTQGTLITGSIQRQTESENHNM